MEIKPENCAQNLFFLVEEMVMEFSKRAVSNEDYSASQLSTYIFRAHRFDAECCINVICCSKWAYCVRDTEAFCLAYLTRLVGGRLAWQAYTSFGCLDRAKDMCSRDADLAHWIKRFFGELPDDQPKPIFGTNPQPRGYEYSHEAMREAWLDASKEDAFNSLFLEHIKPRFCNSKISTRTREGGGMTVEETL